MTLREALSVGKPCVISDAGGNAEIIQDGCNGVVTENGNLNAFSHALRQMINEPNKCNAMG
jgi:glycosyltransferase involved in cell wall biosynthesis